MARAAKEAGGDSKATTAKKARDSYLIVQISDIHCGDPRFHEELMEEAVAEINSRSPDAVVVAGDLTTSGYRDEFEEAKRHLSLLDCPQIVVIAGNHDCRNLGFLHFEELFGPRYSQVTWEFCVECAGVLQENLRLVAADSNKPDLDDGEIGRDHYHWLADAFRQENEFKVFVLHHHLVSIPGTGRERNIVWDAGDVLAKLIDAGVDLVLCGHRHVPYVWQVANTLIISSGTVSTRRTRGYTQPSYNIIEIAPEATTITTKTPGEPRAASKVFPRRR